MHPTKLTATLLTTTLLTLSPALGQATPAGASTTPTTSQLQTRIQGLAARSKVTNLSFKTATDQGLLVNGQLNGRAFALRIPANWNGQTVLFAHGYVGLNDSGQPQTDVVSADPVAQDPSLGLLTAAYSQGFAVGHSAYDKTGLAITTGIERTVALKRFTDTIGSQRAYITGGSMGGAITTLISQRYPRDFAGALAICGAVGDWTYVADHITHVRALYNYFSAKTPYALPGSQDVTHNLTGATQAQVLLTLLKLQQDAQANPQGQAAQIMARVASAVPTALMRDEISTLLSTIPLQASGIEDFNAQAGGQFIDNQTTVYQSALLNDAENEALNAGIQRYSANTAARARATAQFSPSGQQSIKLLTVHNAYDPLATYENEDRLRQRVAQVGRLGNLSQRSVPTLNINFPLPAIVAQAFPGADQLKGTFGAVHCGFTPQQLGSAWNDLRTWVENGVKPGDALRQNLSR